jgi:3-phosphoshikimate 1-carboxyvinyltransferase
MASRRIEPTGRAVDAVLRAASSKSVTHRALVAAALAEGESRIELPLDAEDTRTTRDGLRALGIPVVEDEGAWIVNGSAGRFPGGAEIHLRESGTSFRFLTAVASLGVSESHLDGGPRLRERPGGELFSALRVLGARIATEEPGDRLPVRVGGELPRGGAVDLDAQRSSQFASALLLIGPCFGEGLDLRLIPPVVSAPYVELTRGVLESFGAAVSRLDEYRYRVAPGGLAGRTFLVEGDYSSASYLLCAAAICGGRVEIKGLRPGSLQADSAFLTILEEIGCRIEWGPDGVEVKGSGAIPGFDLHAASCPDLVPTLAALALHAEGPCRVRGVSHLRWKESDRLAVLAENLSRLGRPASAEGSELRVGSPTGSLTPATVRTSSDHRIAMAFAVAGLRAELEIDDAECVSKSYPAFWDDFAGLTARGTRTGS